MKYVYFKKNINRNKSSFVPIIKEDFLKILIHELLGVFFFQSWSTWVREKGQVFRRKVLENQIFKVTRKEEHSMRWYVLQKGE